MALRGPQRTPTAILKLRGSRRADARPDVNATPPRVRPKPPKGLSKGARAVWRRQAPIAHGLGTLTDADVGAFGRYCRLQAEWQRYQAFVEEYGVSYQLKDEAGNFRCFQQFPEVAQANKLAVELLKLEREFGLTPSARASLPGKPGETKPSIPTRSRAS